MALILKSQLFPGEEKEAGKKCLQHGMGQIGGNYKEFSEHQSPVSGNTGRKNFEKEQG